MKNVAKQDEQSTEYWKQKCANLELLVKSYENQLLLMKQKQFGKSSERHLLDGQIFLFNEAEFVANPNIPEPTIEEITYTRKKSKGKREEDLSELAVERIEYELSKEEQVCPECNGELHVFGHEVRKEVEIIPAQFKVVEHSRATYSCRYCEKHNDHVPIIKAVIPKPVISGSVASPSAVAHVMVQKYVNAMPLYRQEQDYLRNGFTLSRQTMANWMIKCSQDWLEPLYERLKELLVKREVAHADETTLQVLKEPGKSPSSKSYMWLYQTCNDTNQHIILYEYQQSRAGYHPKEFLKDFIGYLHTDGYGVYHSLSENITVVGCWAHLRRKFDEAFKVVPKEIKGSAAEKGIEYCQKLFMLERQFANMSHAERYENRLKYSKPVAEEFYKWAESLHALPQSPLGKALNYMFGQWPYLMNVYLDGRLELSNNRAERSIKPVVIGRKNWLFCNTPNGAKASAVIYSIVISALTNGLNPFQYLKYLFEQLPNSNEPMDEFLPWSETIPENCKVPVKRNGENKDGN